MYELRVYLCNGEDYRVVSEGSKAECEKALESSLKAQPKKLHGRFKVIRRDTVTVIRYQ